MADEAARQKWDSRYRDSPRGANPVAEVLRNNRDRLPHHGVALDLACGLGSNALFLAECGLEVHAWDISPVAIDILDTERKKRGLPLQTAVRDCVAQPPEPNRFDVIIVSRFLERSLCPAIIAALRQGGLLFYQTFTHRKHETHGPSNPRYLLHRDELLTLFTELEVVYYCEGDEAMLIARKR